MDARGKLVHVELRGEVFVDIGQDRVDLGVVGLLSACIRGV